MTGKACLVNLSQSLSIQPFSDYIYDDNDDGDDDSDARTGGVFNDDNGDSADDVGGILNNDDDDSDDDVGGVFNTQHVFNHQISYEMRSPLGNQWDAGKGKRWRKCKWFVNIDFHNICQYGFICKCKSEKGESAAQIEYSSL